MATTQLNVRINSEDRRAGDEAFSSLGLTPSQVVQGVWGYAARNRGNKQALREIARIIEPPDDALEAERARKIELAEKGPELFENLMAQLGIKHPEFVEIPSDDELMSQLVIEELGMAEANDE